VLYSFTASSPAGTGDGTTPVAGLVSDASGNLYGTASRGGAFGFGAVFEVSPPATPGGAWAETLLYSFKGVKKRDGGRPFGGLLLDPSGNLFGTTTIGGVVTTDCSQGCGTAFELAAPSTPEVSTGALCRRCECGRRAPQLLYCPRISNSPGGEKQRQLAI
jgi:uncharacterized repeat protein (TIGR03803 family)